MGGPTARSDRSVTARRSRAGPLAACAFLLALSASVVLLVAPLEMAQSERDVPAGELSGGLTIRVERTSLLQEQGWTAAIPMSVPVGVAALGLWPHFVRWRWRLTAASVLLVAWVIVASLSVGIFYLPAAVAMVAAMIVRDRT